MIAALLLLIQQPQTITFSHPCAHSSVVLEALGKAAGLELRPSGSVSKDYFLVSFKDIQVQEALEQIASSLNATWTQKDGMRYLGRTPAQEASDFNVEYRAKATTVRKALADKTLAPLDSKSSEALAAQVRDFGGNGTNEDWNRFRPLARKLPGYRALVRLASKLDWESLVKDVESQVTFGTRRGSQPWPQGSSEVSRDLSKEWAAYAEVSARAGVPETDLYQALSGSLHDLEPSLQLSVQVHDSGVSVMLNCLVGNAWRNIGYESVSFAESGTVPEWVQKLEGPCQRTVAAQESVQPAFLSEVRPEFRAALLTESNGDAVLSAASELLLQAAEQVRSPIVACIPDRAYVTMAESEGLHGMTLRAALSVLLTKRVLTSKQSNGWISIGPADPYTARHHRMDRSAFLRMARQMDTIKSLPLDTYADFVATTNSDETMKVVSHALGRAFELSSGIPMIGLEVLRIYGLMREAERANAREGAYVLPANSDLARFAVPLAGKATMFDEGDSGRTARRPGQERQAALAKLPKNVERTVTVRQLAYVQPLDFGGRPGQWIAPMDPDTFAANRAVPKSANSLDQRDYSRVALVSGWAVNLGMRRLDGSGGGTSFGRYADPMEKLVFIPFDDLPEAIKAAISRAEKTLPRSFGGGGL